MGPREWPFEGLSIHDIREHYVSVPGSGSPWKVLELVLGAQKEGSQSSGPDLGKQPWPSCSPKFVGWRGLLHD